MADKHSNLPAVGEPHRVHEAVGRQGPAAPSPEQGVAPFRERVLRMAGSAVERLGGVANTVFQVLIKDDVDKLLGKNSTPLERLEGAADLASWAIPEGKIAEIAGHALAKAGELAVAHLAVSGAEHAAVETAEHTLGATLTRKNPSEIWQRPLTDAERSGRFKEHKDLAAFLGPATERGGVSRDWHHVVEQTHAESGHFSAEQVHSIDNVVPVDRGLHQGKGGLTATFAKPNPLFEGRTPRDYLHDKPWQQHVAAGERELRSRNIDPLAGRSETRARFEQRLAEHDRHFPPPGRETPQVHPGIAPAAGQVESHGASGHSLLHVVRDGQERTIGHGYVQPGTIIQADGDTILQNTGRGTVAYSRAELLSHANPADRAIFDAALQPGSSVEIRLGQNGLSMQQNVPGRGWEPLGANVPPPSHRVELGIGGR